MFDDSVRTSFNSINYHSEYNWPSLLSRLIISPYLVSLFFLSLSAILNAHLLGSEQLMRTDYSNVKTIYEKTKRKIQWPISGCARLRSVKNII